MEGKNYETALPAGYREVYAVDAKENKKTVALLTLASLVIMAAAIAAAVLLIRPRGFLENFSIVKYALAAGALLVYVVLHELIHLKVPGHGPDFKAELDRYMPDWRSVRRSQRDF